MQPIHSRVRISSDVLYFPGAFLVVSHVIAHVIHHVSGSPLVPLVALVSPFVSLLVSPLVSHLIFPDVSCITYTGRRIGSDGSRTLQPPPTWSPLIISINPLKPLCPPRCTRFEKDPLTVNPRPPLVPRAVVPPLPPPPSAPFEAV